MNHHQRPAMKIIGLHHFTIRCDLEDLTLLEDFYVRVIGLHRGERPNLTRPGVWLYGGESQAIVHLLAAGHVPSPEGSGLDHISFRTTGLQETRSQLARLDIPFTEAKLPGAPLHQLFVRDPIGLKLELTFDLLVEDMGQ